MLDITNKKLFDELAASSADALKNFNLGHETAKQLKPDIPSTLLEPFQFEIPTYEGSMLQDQADDISDRIREYFAPQANALEAMVAELKAHTAVAEQEAESAKRLAENASRSADAAE